MKYVEIISNAVEPVSLGFIEEPRLSGAAPSATTRRRAL
jgi:hypothetical protein